MNTAVGEDAEAREEKAKAKIRNRIDAAFGKFIYDVKGLSVDTLSGHYVISEAEVEKMRKELVEGVSLVFLDVLKEIVDSGQFAKILNGMGFHESKPPTDFGPLCGEIFGR